MTPVERFQSVYRDLDATCLDRVGSLYGPGVHFEDPVHEIHGLEPLKAYLAGLYEGVERCRFEFHEVVQEADRAFLAWSMHLDHRHFQRGRTIVVDGASLIRFDDLVTYHRDYFDLGQLIYERVPVLGRIVRALRRRLARVPGEGA